MWHSYQRSQSRIGLDNTFGDGVACQAGHVMNAEFVHDLLPMFFNRLNADAQFRSDLLIGASLGNELENLGLASSEVVPTSFLRLSAGQGNAAMVPQPSGNCRAEISIAAVRFADGFQQFVG